MKKSILLLFAAFATLVASAKVEIDGIWYNLDENYWQAEVTYKGNFANVDKEYSGSITIPATVTYEGVEYCVTSIGVSAFNSCSNLTAITIPEGVTSIGNCAFSNCTSLITITIPEGVTSIGYRAFYNCSSLTAINIPEGVRSIGYETFLYCSSLTAITVVEGNAVYDSRGGCNAIIETKSNTLIIGCSTTIIPESVMSIGDYAFQYCSSLTAINIPESVMSIGYRAFYNCSSLTAINIPEGVTSIGSGAFYGTAWYDNQPDGVVYAGNVLYTYKGTMPDNTSIEVKEGTKGIADNAFYECSSLTSITIPEGVTSIGDNAFYECSSLTAITIPESVTSIGGYAFQNCSSLTAITIPEGVTSIGAGAFSGCSSLTAITIPESVTNIGNDAFYGCSGLTAITSKALIPPYIEVSYEARKTFYYVNKSIPVCVPEVSVEAYQSAGHWSQFTNIQPIPIASGICGDNLTWRLTEVYELIIEGTGEMYGYECGEEPWHEYRELIQSISLSEGVTNIGDYAFYGCSSLTNINIPESVTSIGDEAFYYCSNLTIITIPESVTRIGYGAFADCSSLTDINIPEGVTSIGDWTFIRCSSLTTITIPEEVTFIGESAFRDCSNLTAIVLPKNVRIIHNGAFSNCAKLLDVYCHAETVPSMPNDTFDGSYPEYATLHVPASALNAYKTTAPWSSFGNIVELEVSIAEITLDQTLVILTEGEELTLTVTTTPNNADRNLISWSSSNASVATVDNNGKVTAVAPGTAIITATANDGSGVSASCEIVVNELILGKCATPTISYENGQVSITCDTEEAKVITTIMKGDDETREEMKFAYIPTQTFTAYATKENYENSDMATLTLCWIPCTEEHEEEEGTTGIITIPSKPVLISTQGGTITVSGLAAGTEVAVYNTAGTQLATATATDGTATLATGLTTGDIAIVKMGEHSIKIVIK